MSDAPFLRSPDSPSSKAAYQDLFDRSIDAILLIDIANGIILEANDAAQNILQTPSSQLHNRNVFDYCHPDHVTDFKKNVRIASRRYHPKLFEVPLVVGSPKPDKPIISSIAISPLKLNDGNELLQFIIRDITQQKEYERKIELMATTDGLTGLMNVRKFKEMLQQEHSRALRYRSKYSIIFADVDHFKKYNDQHGHPAGDAVLKAYAVLFKNSVRATDIPARYGGEEFIVLLPETDIEQAAHIAERIRADIQAYPFEKREMQPLGYVSASIGVACFPQDGSDWTEVLKTADDCLYQAKKDGRNRVKVKM